MWSYMEHRGYRYNYDTYCTTGTTASLSPVTSSFPRNYSCSIPCNTVPCSRTLSSRHASVSYMLITKLWNRVFIDFVVWTYPDCTAPWKTCRIRQVVVYVFTRVMFFIAVYLSVVVPSSSSMVLIVFPLKTLQSINRTTVKQMCDKSRIKPTDSFLVQSSDGAQRDVSWSNKLDLLTIVLCNSYQRVQSKGSFKRQTKIWKQATRKVKKGRFHWYANMMRTSNRVNFIFLYIDETLPFDCTDFFAHSLEHPN